ncbi:MAG: ABC transporter ATP-binding protein [Chloroflexi bacterium]|nr:ABC transporter ATP-binding protein [Chloroflexota bacterium]
MGFALEATIEEFRYPRQAQPAICAIDLKVREGEFVVIAGPAGAGKTTLCYCLAGVIPHFASGLYRGVVKVGGQSLAKLRLPEIAALVGFVLQRPENQLFNLTVAEDVAFGPENLCADPDDIRSRLKRSLAFVGMSDFARRMSDTLSGGETQRVVLSCVLAMDPHLYVLDQPAAELDPLGRKQAYDHIYRLNREAGKTVLLVEDRLSEVLPFASRLVLMSEGRIVAVWTGDAPLEEFFADEKVLSSGIRVPDSIKLRYLLRGSSLAPKRVCLTHQEIVDQCLPLLAKWVGSSNGANQHGERPGPTAAVCHAEESFAGTQDRLRAVEQAKNLGHRRLAGQERDPSPSLGMTGRPPGVTGTVEADWSPDRRAAPRPVVVQDLAYRYPRSDRWALMDVSLAFHRGEFTAIIGENGAGKTTLAKHLVGLLRPVSGKVLVDEQDIGRISTARLSDTISYVFQDPDYQIFCDSVFDEVAFSLKIRKVSPKQVVERVNNTLHELGLFAVRERHPYRLSRGQRQRLALASALIHGPKVLVVDEPSAGLDYRETVETMELLARFREAGGTVLVITHDIEMVVRYAGRSIVMAGGRVLIDVGTTELHKHFDVLARAAIQLPDLYRLVRALDLPPTCRDVEEVARLIVESSG